MNDDRELKEKARVLMEKLGREAEACGYHLNPDEKMVMTLCEGLITNLEQYGYMGCPCRLMEGEKFKDLDVICPCDYRDPDLNEYGMCYCALYVVQEVLDGEKETASIPERRPLPEEILQTAKKRRRDPASVGIREWRCKVCGYLCARESPPEECPICKARKDRFETYKEKREGLYVCGVCGAAYDPEEGDPDRGVEPGTPFQDLPDDWTCPVCKASKHAFSPED